MPDEAKNAPTEMLCAKTYIELAHKIVANGDKVISIGTKGWVTNVGAKEIMDEIGVFYPTHSIQIQATGSGLECGLVPSIEGDKRSVTYWRRLTPLEKGYVPYPVIT